VANEDAYKRPSMADTQLRIPRTCVVHIINLTETNRKRLPVRAVPKLASSTGARRKAKRIFEANIIQFDCWVGNGRKGKRCKLEGLKKRTYETGKTGREIREEEK
jgi:hypothetical protein